MKTAAELADEETKRAIEQIKGAAAPPPPPLRQRQAGNGPTVPARSLIQILSDMTARDRDDYAELIASLRRFVEQKRADLEAFERLMGTK